MADEVMNGAPAMVGEQAADFAALMARAAEGDEAAAPGEPEAAAPDPGEQWAMIPAMIGSALAIALPELRDVYSEGACRAWGASMVPVAEKYGWGADGILCPEVGLLAASLPFVVGTVTAVNRRKAPAAAAAKKSAPVQQIAAPAPAVMAGTVGFGEVRAHEAVKA